MTRRHLTGLTDLQTDLLSKRLGMLHEVVPTVSLIALLVNPNNRPLAEADTRQAQVAARLLRVSLLVLNASAGHPNGL